MSSIIKTKAFVLRKLDFGDTSKIATFYTKDFGKVSGIIKGGKSSKSKIGKAVDLINFLEIIFYKKESREIQIVTQADLIEYYPKIKDDFEKLKYASAIIELVMKLSVENDPHSRLFKGLERILERLNNENTLPILLFAKFYRFFLAEIGYGLTTDKCTGCNKSLKESNGVFYNYELGFMCNECSSNHMIFFEFSSELFNQLTCLTMQNIKCSYKENDLQKIILFFEKYLTYYVDEFNGLNSLKIY